MLVMFFDSVDDDLVVDKVNKGSVFHDYVTACLNNLVAIKAHDTLNAAAGWLWQTHLKRLSLPADDNPRLYFTTQVARLKGLLADAGVAENGAWLPFEIFKHHHIHIRGQHVAVVDSVEEDGDYGIILMHLEDVKEVKL